MREPKGFQISKTEIREFSDKKCGSKGRIFYALILIYPSENDAFTQGRKMPLQKGRNKKRVTAVTHYLVNLKSNTMKNTHANIEIIYEPRKLFRRKVHLFNSY